MSLNLSISEAFTAEVEQGKPGGKGLRRWDARVKLGLAALAVVANVGFASLRVSLALVAAAWLGMLLSHVGWRRMLWFGLLPLWASAVAAAGFAVGFGVTPLLKLGTLTIYEEGLWQGAGVAARALADVGWMALLFLVTPFDKLLKALLWYRVPGVLVETLGFMYRYVFLLWDEFAALRLSAKARGGMAGRMAALKTTGAILAQVFLRAYDRAQRIAWAIQARGG